LLAARQPLPKQEKMVPLPAFGGVQVSVAVPLPLS
jgi:hypothetical protein